VTFLVSETLHMGPDLHPMDFGMFFFHIVLSFLYRKYDNILGLLSQYLQSILYIFLHFLLLLLNWRTPPVFPTKMYPSIG